MPSNQWQKEVNGWFQTALAKEQTWALEFATGPRNLQTSPSGRTIGITTVPSVWDNETSLCDQQMIRDNGSHQSFSVLGLALTLLLGGLIIVAGLTVDTVIGWLFMPKYKQQQWSEDEVLALLKRTMSTDQSGSTPFEKAEITDKSGHAVDVQEYDAKKV